MHAYEADVLVGQLFVERGRRGEEDDGHAERECCNPLLDCFLCDSRSMLLAVLCLFWPYMGPRGPPIARHPSQPVATLQQRGIFFDAEAVGKYLTREKGMRAVDDHRGDEWKRWAWKG